MFDDDVDPDDELFRRALQRAAGPAPDAFTSLEAFANVRRAPVRRRGVAGARLAVLAAAAAVVLVLAAANRRQETGRQPLASAPTTATSVRPASTTRPTGMSSTREDAPTSTAASTTTAVTVPTSGVVVEPVDGGDQGGVAGATDTTASGADGGGRGNRGPGGGSASSPSTVSGAVTTSPVPSAATTAPAGGATAVTPAPAVTRSFSVTGGTVTVTIRAGAFGKPTIVTSAGWDADVRDATATRVDIRFKNDGNENNVRLDLLANGDVQVTQGRNG